MTRIQDQFTRPDGNLIGVTSDAWSWVKISGNDTGFLVYGNQLSRTPDQSTAAVYANKAFATQDQFFEFGTLGGFPVGTATLNFACRINYDRTAATGYIFSYVPKIGTTAGRFSLTKLGGVAVTGVGVDTAMASDEYFKVRVSSTKSGTTQTVTLFVNDAQILQLVDSSGTPNSGTNFAMTSYANSARKDANNKSFYADDFKAGDIVNPSRYNLSQYDGSAEVPVKLEAIKDGTTAYEQSYVDYVVGEPDAQYPPGYNAGYYNS